MGVDARLDHDRSVLLDRISEMEGKIRELNDELVRSNRLATLGLLTGMVAHEFNNLLTPVISYAHLAMASPEDSALVQKSLTRVVDGTEQVAKIATALLGFIREERTLESADVGRVLEETLACMGREPEKFGVTLKRRIPKSTRVSIRPVALQQVFMNLFLNAFEAMKGKGGELSVTCGPVAGNDAAVEIRVKDTGRGIPREVLERMFRPMMSWRPGGEGEQGAGGSSGSGVRGSGLGLVVCKKLVEDAGGRIEVESQVGLGTVFTITLPRWAGETSDKS